MAAHTASIRSSVKPIRGEVRAYIRDNAMMWLEDYRVDGLRYDMTLYIRSVDASGMNKVREALYHNYNCDVFQRVVYTEFHDEVANGKARIPTLQRIRVRPTRQRDLETPLQQ